MRKLSRPVIALGAGLALVLGTSGAALATGDGSAPAAPVLTPAGPADDDGGLLGLGLLGGDDDDNDGLLGLDLLGDDDNGRDGLLGTGLLGEDGGVLDVDTLDVQLILDGLRVLGLNLDGLDDGEGPVLDIDGLLITLEAILSGQGPGQGDGVLGLNLFGNDDRPGPSNDGGLLGTGLLGDDDGGLLGGLLSGDGDGLLANLLGSGSGSGDGNGLLGNLLGNLLGGGSGDGSGVELGDGDDLLGNDPL
ncbi:MAG: hypothetical protein ACT4PP_09800 [Sporichthyaceae bacterium]